MAFILNCKIRGDAMATLMALRTDHLTYIQNHSAEILFGGPARGDDGVPKEMIIVLRTNNRAEAEAFINAEPYTASGKIFLEILIRPWSQVMPEISEGWLERTIAAERARSKV